ncbi:MAG: alpha/beta hydrolase [Clostridium butyricum]|nr:alpha/beta hydrolase [Clostridium butyricum]
MNSKFYKSKFISYLDLDAEIKRTYISENNYEEDMINIVEPYVSAYRESGYISGVENVNLYFEKYIVDNPKGNIVICHGFGEFSQKYTELIYYFLKESYSVFFLEHRGHARSQRLGKDKSQINVKSFDNYIEDFKKFLDKIVMFNLNNKKLLLFAHSMGGGIGTAFLEKYPQYFNGAVLSSPMHEINTGKYSKIVAAAVSSFLTLVGMGKEYLPGQKPYTGNKKFPSSSTHSENRWNYQYKLRRENENYQTGGAGAKWYCEAIKVTRRIVKKNNAKKVKIPVMLIQAEYDKHVMPEGQIKFAKNAVNCKVIIAKGSKHESFCEKDNITFHTIDKIIDFYENI